MHEQAIRMSARKTLSVKIRRFLAVGLANTAVDFAVFALLVGVSVLFANLAAWAVALSFSYMVNSRWSFDRTRRHREAFPRFAVLGALVSLGVSSLALGVFAPFVGIWPAKIAGTILAAILNFIVARWAFEGGSGSGPDT